jgi:hypothetical protein
LIVRVIVPLFGEGSTLLLGWYLGFHSERTVSANLPKKIEICFWVFGLGHKLHGLRFVGFICIIVVQLLPVLLYIFFDQQYIIILARNAEHHLQVLTLCTYENTNGPKSVEIIQVQVVLLLTKVGTAV